jgi:hypothetical protein
LSPDGLVRGGSLPSLMPSLDRTSISKYTIIVSAVEINDDHGVGIFLRRLFPDTGNFIAIRSASLYPGENRFGSAEFEFGKELQNTEQRANRFRQILQGHKVNRILAVPYYPEDFENAFAAKSLTEAPLCVYLMDDQNIFEPSVPDRTVFRLLKAADLRLAISREMALAYQEKFGVSFHVLPPVMTQLRADQAPSDVVSGVKRAALLGNIWRIETLRRFRELIRKSDLRVDWFGNGPKAPWLQVTARDLEKDNIYCQGFLPDASLLRRLQGYPFMIVPSGTLGPDDPNLAFSRLSLPSRLIFALVGAQIPSLVLGHAETAAGRFVRDLGIGVVAGYDSEDLARAMGYLLDPETQRLLRKNGQRTASRLVLEEGGEWIWRSLERGKPATSQFRDIFPLPSMHLKTWRTLRWFAAAILSLGGPNGPRRRPELWADSGHEL